MKSHKDLTVYKDSIQFVTLIYKKTLGFPHTEQFGLTNQIRRSAVSIPSNIAEGAARNHTKENIQFIHIALASASELDTQLEIAMSLEFLEKVEYELLLEKLNSISKMIQGLLKYQKAKLNSL